MVNPSAGTENRQEFQCKDCGNVYYFAGGQYSSLCMHCGNVAYHGGEAIEKKRKESTSLLGRTILSRLHVSQAPKELNWQVNAKDVESIISRFQVEWQLWAQVVLHFDEPVYHLAYITHIMTNRDFATATKRYIAHRSISVPLSSEKWQAEVADAMLYRIESMVMVQFTREQARSYPSWIKDLPWDKQFFLVGIFLIVATVIGPLVLKIFH